MLSPKRASGKSLDNVLEADFGTGSIYAVSTRGRKQAELPDVSGTWGYRSNRAVSLKVC
jgi:hypothetical protein